MNTIPLFTDLHRLLADAESFVDGWRERLVNWLLMAKPCDRCHGKGHLPSGKWWKPGAELEASGLGRWPTSGSNSVWSEAAWLAALVPQEIPANVTILPEIGADIARFGGDKTVIIVRVGPCVMHYEEHQGWDGPRIVGRLKELAFEWAAWATRRLPLQSTPFKPNQIQVKVEEDGMGGMGVVDWMNPGWKKDFNIIPISAGGAALDPERYVNCRSEMWFETMMRAKTRRLDLSRLPKEVLAKLRVQAMAPTWKFVGARRSVEGKKEMKERMPSLGSPDGLDSLNVCCRSVASNTVQYISVPEPVGVQPLHVERKMFGRRD